MRFVALILSAALVLTGCSHAAVPATTNDVTLPTLYSTGPIEQVNAFAISTPVALSSGNPVVPLAEIPQVPTDQGNLGLTMWGTKDASGAVTAITQAQVQGIGAGGGSVHIFFDSASLPVLFRDDATGYAIALSNENTTQVTFTLCDPNGAADSNVTMTNSSGAVSVGAVSDGGSCVLKNADAVHRDGSGTHRMTLTYSDVTSLTNLLKAIAAGSYVAGFAFSLAAILKYKSHKDNPTQVPIGTPIALVFIAAALLFLPSILGVSGATIFDGTSLTPIGSALPTYLPEGTLSALFPSPDPTP